MTVQFLVFVVWSDQHKFHEVCDGDTENTSVHIYIVYSSLGVTLSTLQFYIHKHRFIQCIYVQHFLYETLLH